MWSYKKLISPYHFVKPSRIYIVTQSVRLDSLLNIQIERSWTDVSHSWGTSWALVSEQFHSALLNCSFLKPVVLSFLDSPPDPNRDSRGKWASSWMSLSCQLGKPQQISLFFQIFYVFPFQYILITPLFVFC